MKPTITVAIIHAPGLSGAHIREIWGALLAESGHRGIRLDEVHVNPGPDDLSKSRSMSEPTQLILLWCLPGRPDWDDLVRKYCQESYVVHLVVMTYADVGQEHSMSEAHPFAAAAGHGVAAQKKNRMENFMAGFFNGQTPYGYKRTRLPGTRKLPKEGECAKGPYWLELGDPDEVDIVHYIFEAFVNEGLTRTQILHALITRGIAVPPGMKRWTPCKITNILSDPVYIGANRHTGFYRHDVFPPLISKEKFYRAQALLTANSSPSSEFLEFHAAGHSDLEECAER